MKIKLTRDDYEVLIYKAVHETLHDQSRWSVCKTWVVPYNGKHYETEGVAVAATECQETEWPDEMELTEVELKEVTVKQWVAV